MQVSLGLNLSSCESFSIGDLLFYVPPLDAVFGVHISKWSTGKLKSVLTGA
jgi:hypothetical protein